MRKKTELQQAKQFFKEHPGEVKYNRAESGLSSSYMRNPQGKITRLANSAEVNYVEGEGEFARVKRSESGKQSTVMKIQTKPLEMDLDAMQYIREQVQREAEINLDFGIAIAPLIEKLDLQKGRVKYYQEMRPLQSTLESRLEDASPVDRIHSAIDFLLLVDACHCGELTESGTGYMHGDLSSKNVMYDSAGKMHLIDFAFAEPMKDNLQLFDDYKEAMRTLYHQKDPNNPDSLDNAASIFSTEQFDHFPIFLQKTLAWEKSSRPDINPKQLFPFITAVLIAYSENSELTEEEVQALKEDSCKQMMVIEIYRRSRAIAELPTEIAQKTLNKIMSRLARYERFLDKKCQQMPSSATFEEQALWLKKREIVSHLTGTIQFLQGLNKSPQSLLGIIDKNLLENEALLSPNEEAESRSVLSYLQSKLPFSSGDMDVKMITKKIDKKIGHDSHEYREALREHRERTGTATSSISDDEDKSSSAEASTPKKNS